MVFSRARKGGLLEAACWSGPLLLAVLLVPVRSREISPGSAPESCGDGTPPTPTQELPKPLRPWKTNQEYLYTWVEERRKVGETRFRIEELKKTQRGGRTSAARYRIPSRLEHSREGISRKMEVESFFGAGGELLQYRSRTFLSSLRNATSSQEVEGRLEGNKLVFISSFNQDPKTRAQGELLLPKGTSVVIPQAVEFWAFLITRLPRDKKSWEMHLAYPNFGKVYEVKFELKGEESLDSGEGKAAKCRWYRFRSSEGQLSGEVWVDGEGRLFRYKQGPLTIQLETEAG